MFYRLVDLRPILYLGKFVPLYHACPVYNNYISIACKVEKDFAFGLFDLEWDTIDEIMEAACKRIPDVENAGISSTVVGPGIPFSS